jgi:hypothetical protein
MGEHSARGSGEGGVQMCSMRQEVLRCGLALPIIGRINVWSDATVPAMTGHKGWTVIVQGVVALGGIGMRNFACFKGASGTQEGHRLICSSEWTLLCNGGGAEAEG